MVEDVPELPQVPGQWATRVIDVGAREIKIALPADPDAILEHAVTIEQNRIHDYMPYWCWLWPAALKMASVVHRLPVPAEEPLLEIGSGLGLVGIAAALAGHTVVMSDYRDESLQAARYNAVANGIPDPDVRLIDWRNEPTQRFGAVMACDVLYEVREHQPILDFVSRLLTDNGECWIGDPGRQRASEFVSTASDRFQVRLFAEDLSEVLVPSVNDFFLIRLSKQTEDA